MRGRTGHGDNLKDARASGNCFQENCNPEPYGLLYPTEAVLGPRSRKGASAKCCSLLPLGRGLWSGLGFGAPLFLDRDLVPNIRDRTRT